MLSVIIPIYNERETIRLLYEKTAQVLTKMAQPWEILFINDGSKDGSEEELDTLASEDTHVRVLHFRRNFGQTAAMMAGFDYARGDVIIPMDGDYQNDPEDIPKMLAKLNEGYDVVSGWRRDRQDNAIKRNLPSIMANKLIAFVSGVKLQDFGCSLKAYRREVVEGVRLYGEMHRFLPVYTMWHGAKITEVVVGHFARRAGKSKYGLERILKVLLDLMVVKFLDRHAQKPMYVFGMIGFIMIALSTAFALWAVALNIFDAKPFITTPLPLMTTFTLMTGVLCVLMGLLAEMITRTFYESQGKRIYLVRASRNLETK